MLALLAAWALLICLEFLRVLFCFGFNLDKMLNRNLFRASFQSPQQLRRRCLDHSRLWRSHPCRSTKPFTFTAVQWQTKTPKENIRNQLQFKPEKPESIKPETVQKPVDAEPDEAPKTDGLLSEQTVSNKEQRKADWAIIKEMAKYLWPKVCRHSEVSDERS